MTDLTEKMLVGWPSYADEVTLSGGSWEAGFPLSKLLDYEELARPARSSDLAEASLVIQGALPESRPIGGFLLDGHTITTGGEYDIEIFSDDSFTTEVYSATGWIWPHDESADPEWEDDNFFEHTPAPASLLNTKSLAIILVPFWTYGKSFRISIRDAGNPNGLVRIRSLDVFKGHQFTVNFARDSGLGFEDRTLVVTAKGGAEYAENQTNPRIFDGRVNLLPQVEAMGVPYELQRQNTRKRPFLVICNPQNPSNWHREAAFVKNTEFTMLRRTNIAGRWRWDFVFKEAF